MEDCHLDVHRSQKKLVDKLRNSDPEKFATLCRMHLCFTLDLSHEEFSALLEPKKSETKSRKGFGGFGKKTRPAKGIMDGLPLTQEAICQVFQLIKYLSKDFNISQEGLFRKTGSVTRQQELKTLLNVGAIIDLDAGHYSSHDCASVLKNFLAEMPEPLLMESHFTVHCQVPRLYQEDLPPSLREKVLKRQLKTVQLLILLLPIENQFLLKDILMLLHKVTKARQMNKMDSVSLATLFAPHLLCPRKMSAMELQADFENVVKVVSFMIDHVHDLFKAPAELVQDIKMHFKEQEAVVSPLTDAAQKSDAIHTAITFCDRGKKGGKNSADYTSHQLAELYAYVQCMPDSSQKKRFLKQFNKENGFGTPKINKVRNHKRSRSVGDSIKRHFLRASFKKKITLGEIQRSSSLDILENEKKDLFDTENAPTSNMDDARNIKDKLGDKRKFQEKKTVGNSPPVIVPKLMRTGTPLSRTVLRASKRMKAAVMIPRSRNSVVLTPN
ncbi:rho GTPase-activating protein 19-like isoform X1 [Limulus polyphemus]|uniref:Rho GTPase-activating protein 19-like isoform X1 n=2 Tax=Limulus polyphemus TaxID=6850 RepID=A0ABM1TJ17_LIMPO|nr:rho GTPase-activating protein 19-like isoform X1 [Limulus polyphemus]